MLFVDGSLGEGGGQVLRTSLALSLVTGQPFAIEKIRAGRPKPGLQRQHLTAVHAAAEVGGAAVEGDALGSQRLVFKPRSVRGGAFRFAIATAGSTTLVLQTVLPALWAAGEPSTVELQGGTHNPLAPPFDFLQHAFAPVMHRMGAPLQLGIDTHGFYPAGGGRWRAAVQPAAWTPCELLGTSERPQCRARIVLSRLAHRIGEREASTLRARLGLRADEVTIEEVESPGPGNAVHVRVQLGEVTEVVTALGERGVLAEDVAAAAANEVEALLAAKVPVGEHLADQLLLPMALAGGGAFRTVPPSLHTTTNAQVIERFLPVAFAMAEDGARPGTWIVRCARR